MEERAQELALYIIENKATVRAAASRFGISKSTVHTVIAKQNGLCGPPQARSGKERISVLMMGRYALLILIAALYSGNTLRAVRTELMLYRGRS